ncbi:AlpA family transcriptional regulator [Sphingomonas sp. PP-CE-1A-559]|uniref:helix-turn-helix transcriptional regulator n=1 Tax=Sphingomonas sp. PP-CE-1A-559 TaxID=2135657 RepID=UPI0010560E1E|nr:AlpA family transcriptional regulator [Sphingomonas sp. PP-CE-1A-559]
MTNLLRRPEVLSRVGLSRSTIYNEMALGNFPRPIKIGRRAVAWHASAIDNWISSRPASTGGMI